jgi:sugar phosphate isomerase/epimerase
MFAEAPLPQRDEMTCETDRRRFLQTCAVSAAGVGLGLMGTNAKAIEPIARSAEPKFKFSCAAYGYRDLLQGDDTDFTLFDFVDDCAKMQLEGTELTSYYFPKPITETYLHELKKRCFQQGLDVSGTAVGNDFAHPPGEERDKQIAHVRQWVDYAQVLGAPVIRIFAGHAKPGVRPDETHRLVVEGIETCCEYAGQHGVHLALENHGGPTKTADELLAIVRDVDSPWFGVNLDSGNFTGDDVYDQFERVAPYALNVQVKVSLHGADNKRQRADFRRLAQILRDAGYRGYVVLEYEESGDPRVDCPKLVHELREAFA